MEFEKMTQKVKRCEIHVHATFSSVVHFCMPMNFEWEAPRLWRHPRAPPGLSNHDQGARSIDKNSFLNEKNGSCQH